MTDNKNEEFPIVDEMGNILGAITRGHAHDARYCILWFICMYSIVRENCISSTVRHGRISSLISGILPVVDMWI